MRIERSSGILLHPTSLPGGRLGREAYAFVDWLAAAGQSWWQMLPLGPPDEHGSPYRSASAFAGWRGLLAEPRAPVSAAELEAFAARHPFWAAEWSAYAGRGALADQVRFEREWGALRAYAAGRGVRLIGDLPIYVAPGSADHLAFPELFQSGAVAGVPPDAYSADGQLWGNPLYDWGALRATAYRWWVERFRRMFELFDLVRLDHFRGFVAYWAVPEGRRTARTGVWRRGPGRDVFDAAASELGELAVIAEDLGVITPAVVRLRRGLGFPGTLVIQWGFGPDASRVHRVEQHEENAVVYTATHDNDTALGWWRSLSPAVRRETGLPGREPSWEVLDLAFSSRARLAIAPLQDVLGLGSDSRMNTPGTVKNNWRWRFRRGSLSIRLAEQLRQLTAGHGRLSR